MSVKRAWDWSVTDLRRAVHVSEARMGLVSHRLAPRRSCQWSAHGIGQSPTCAAPFMSVKRTLDWSVTDLRRAVHVSEARMGLVSHRLAPRRSCQWSAHGIGQSPTCAAPFMSVKRTWDWSVTDLRRAVHVSEARMGLVSHRLAPRRSCQWSAHGIGQSPPRDAPFMSVKRAWDWSTVATCFPRGPEIAVRVTGGRLQKLYWWQC